MLFCSEGRRAMILSFTSIFGSAMAQHIPIRTSTQSSDDVARTCWLHNTPRGIDRTWCNAIRDSNRLRQHCQARLWEEISPCEVRAPNKILYTEQDTSHFLFFKGDTIKADEKLFATACKTTDHKCRQLGHLKQQKLMRMTRQLMEVRATCLIGYDTHFILVLRSTETGLCRTEREDVTYVRAAPRGLPLQLPLFLHKGLVLSPARFNFAPSGPTLLQKPIQQLVEQLQRSDVIPTNHKCRAEAAQTLSCYWSRSNGRQNTIHKFFEKATCITAKLSVGTGYQLGPMQPSRERRRESVYHRLQGTANDLGQRTLTIVLQGEWWSFPNLLQQAVDKGVVPLICCSGGVNEIVGNWNRNMYQIHGNGTTITHVLLWWRSSS